MMSVPTIDETISFITAAHGGPKGQGRHDYFHHPIDVMNRLPPGTDDDVRLAALLHDVIEDTAYTRSDLEQLGYSARTLDIVDVVTKSGEALPYGARILKVIATANTGAMRLKLADIEANTDPKRLEKLPSDLRAKLAVKYDGAAAMLKEALGLVDSASNS